MDSSSGQTQKVARKRGRPPKCSMQYSSKLKKDAVQVIRTETITLDETTEQADETEAISGAENIAPVLDPNVPKDADKDDDTKDLSRNLDSAISDFENDDFLGKLLGKETDFGESSDQEKVLEEEKQPEKETKDKVVNFEPATNKSPGAPSPAQNTKKTSRLKLVTIAKVKKNKSKKKHNKAEHSERKSEKQKCSKCDFVGSEEKLELHMKRAHKDNIVYSCSMCSFTCSWNREYYKHMKVHFHGPPYECDFEACDYVVERIQPLLYHRMVRHTVNTRI